MALNWDLNKTNSLIQYHSTTSILDDHWSVKLDKKFGVGTIEVNDGHKLWVKINPTDRRGYRLIVQYVGKDLNDIKSTLNRRWTIEEMDALAKMQSILSQFYLDLELIPQIYWAGNKSMEHHETDDQIIIVGKKEPSMLHFHILGRGDPKTEFIHDPNYDIRISLDSPEIGEEFNLKGEGDEKLNMKKLSWPNQGVVKFKTLLVNFLMEKVEQKYIVLFTKCE